MIDASLARVFDNTRGNISIYDSSRNEEILTRNFDDLLLFASNAEEPAIDIVTDQGEAVAKIVHGDPRMMSPPPTFPMYECGIYLNSGAPLLGQKRGQAFLSPELVADCASRPRYALADLTVETPGSQCQISYSTGRRRTESAGGWKTKHSTFREFSERLICHKQGQKDGPCFLQGETANGTRQANAMIANYILSVDLDDGISAEELLDKLIASRLEAVLYTTYNHLKDSTLISRDAFMRWSGSRLIEPTEVGRYLQQVKKMRPEILTDMRIIDDACHTEEGIMIKVGHRPVPKFRVVFPLEQPFIFARRGSTLSEAHREWKERYAGFCTQLGLPFDESCCDPARLFYFPRHPDGSTVHETNRVAGKPLNLDQITRAPLGRKTLARAKAMEGVPIAIDSNVAPKMETPEGPRFSVDPSLMKGRSPEEQRHLRELNDRCAISFMGSNLRVIWQPDPSRPPKFISVKDAREAEATRIVQVKGDGGTRALKMFNEWMTWPGRREYDEIRFAPGVDEPRIYNLFDGWAVTPCAGDWSLLREHIKTVICNGNAEQFDWFMTWLAQMFQCPGEKLPVAVVIRGMKGTGKSIIFDLIQRIMPRYLYKVADGKRALGNFNAQYESTILLVMEEAFWAGDQAKESVLKDLITGTSLAIERKGIDPYMAKNHMRVAMISNERWVVPASHDERRYAFFDCGSQHRGDIAYFKKMIAQMDNGGTAAMLHDLLEFEPENGWDVLLTPPASSGLQEQVIDSLRGVDRFMYELLLRGMYECDSLDDSGIFLSEDSSTSVSMKDLRAAVRDHLADHFVGQKAANYNLVERAVRDWFGAEILTRRAKQNEVRWVDFPSLSQSREHVRRTKGIEVPPAL